VIEFSNGVNLKFAKESKRFRLFYQEKKLKTSLTKEKMKEVCGLLTPEIALCPKSERKFFLKLSV